jgi:hypothetical protein
MQRSAQKTSSYAHLTNLILVAFCIGVFCAPQTLAGSGPQLPLACFGADDSSDFIRDGKLGEYFSWRHPKTMPAYTAASPASLGPVIASRAPVQSSCAPEYRCFGFYPVCWYELLNSEWNTSCPSKWVFQNGYQPIVGNPCTVDPLVRSTSLVVVPNAGTFYQDFFVPYDATGSLDVEVRFQTLGNGTWWDRIHVELWEGNTQLGIYRFPSKLNCGVGSYKFFGNFAGKNLRVKVMGSIITPGVVHRIENISLVSELP